MAGSREENYTGVLATAGGLVFHGQIGGGFAAVKRISRDRIVLVALEGTIMQTKSVLATSWLVCGLVSACIAQDSAHVTAAQVVGAAQLDSYVTKTEKGVALKQIPTDAGSTVLIVRRDSGGEVELHWRMNDIFVVKSGRGTLLLGGRIEHNHETAPSEWRGGEIIGGEKHELSPGDLVLIPAGVPHQVLLPPGGSITYVAIKTLAQPLPAQPPSNH
jgi:mannose-6-phosphate isomerase-like protein (cupin superfamily)